MRCGLAAVFLISVCTWTHASATIIGFESYDAFASQQGSPLSREDWSSVPHGVIEGQEIEGITYAHEDHFDFSLAVGNGGGWGFRLGVVMPNGVSNFGWSDKITFTFSSGLDAFGVMFSQGTYDGFGSSTFAVQIDGGPIFYRSVPVVSGGPNVGYLGLAGLGGAESVSIWRTESDADSVWTAYHIDYSTVPVPHSMTAGFVLMSILGLFRWRICC